MRGEDTCLSYAHFYFRLHHQFFSIRIHSIIKQSQVCLLLIAMHVTIDKHRVTCVGFKGIIISTQVYVNVEKQERE